MMRCCRLLALFCFFALPLSAQDDLSRAFEAWQSGKPLQAESHVRRFLKTKPEDPAARKLLGRVLVNLGQDAEARNLLNKLIRDGHADRSVHVLQAQLEERAGRPESARAHLWSARLLAPKDHSLVLAQLALELRSERVDLARETIKTPGLPLRKRNWIDARIRLAQLSEQHREARILIELSFLLDREARRNPRRWLELAEARRLDGDLSAALAALVSAAELPSKPEVEQELARGRAELAWRIGDEKTFAAAAEKIESGDDLAAKRDLLFGRGWLHRSRGRRAEAARCFEQWFSGRVDSEKNLAVPLLVDLRRYLMEVAMENGDDAASLRHLEALLTLEPDRVDRLLEAADSCRRRGKMRRAHQHLTEYIVAAGFDEAARALAKRL